jgi:hypothetical protein
MLDKQEAVLLPLALVDAELAPATFMIIIK